MTELNTVIREMLESAYLKREGAGIAREEGDQTRADEMVRESRLIVSAADRLDPAHTCEAWSLAQ